MSNTTGAALTRSYASLYSSTRQEQPSQPPSSSTKPQPKEVPKPAHCVESGSTAYQALRAPPSSVWVRVKPRAQHLSTASSFPAPPQRKSMAKPTAPIERESTAYQALRVPPPPVAMQVQRANVDPQEGVDALSKAVGGLSLKEKAKEGKARGKESQEQPSTSSSLEARVFKTFENAHDDDIHALVLLDDNTFISGSKDGGLKKWSVDGSKEAQILMNGKLKGVGYDYRQWITAAAKIDRDTWVHGSRNGVVNLWKTDGTWIKAISVEPPKISHKCKPRNYERINCLAAPHPTSKDSDLFVGQATGFARYNLSKGDKLGSCQTSANDWVYCIHPLTLTNMLVVTGTRLQIWNATSTGRWKHHAPLIDEPKRSLMREEGKQQHRPYISAIKPLQDYPDRFGVAVFDGSVRICDIRSGQQVFNQKEHVGRVWMVENLFANVFASCSDDHTIKVWDARQTKSVMTLKDDLGRVSVLLNIGNSTLVAGSCPENLRTAQTFARLRFYDIR